MYLIRTRLKAPLQHHETKGTITVTRLRQLTSPTFSLLCCDMRQSEHGEETLLILQFWGLVHLLRGETGVELGQRSAFCV